MQFWGSAPFTAPCSFRKNANPFAVLQHAGSSLQSRSVSTASFDGESANARNNHAQEALARTKQGIAGN